MLLERSKHMRFHIRSALRMPSMLNWLTQVCSHRCFGIMSKTKDKESLDHEELSQKLLELQDSAQEGGPEYGSTVQYDLPATHLRQSILALFCCCPCGLLALLNAVKVKKKFKGGDMEGAESASEKALRYSSTSFKAAFLFLGTLLLLLACIGLGGILVGIDTLHMGGYH